MIVLKLILFTLFITVSRCRIPDKVYCSNKECDGPISKAKTLLSYTSIDPDLLSFQSNNDALVYMKSAGTNVDLWFVKINGKSGLVNSKFLREYKIIERNLEIVPFEGKRQRNIVQPDKVQKPHEVFEGTTIYTTESAVNAAQQDSSTESPIISSNKNLLSTQNSETETSNKIVENVMQNISSQDGIEVDVISENQLTGENIYSELLNKEPSTSPPEITEISKQSATSNDVNLNVESSTETITEPSKEVTMSNSEGSESEVAQDTKITSMEAPVEALPSQQIVSTGSGSLNSGSIVEVAEKQDYLQNTLKESDQTDGNEQNTSTLNKNLENGPVSEEASSDSNNVPNGNGFNEHQEANSVDNSKEPAIYPPTESTVSPTTESDFYPPTEPALHSTTQPAPSPFVGNPTNQPEEPPKSEPLIAQAHEVLPPIYSNIKAGSQYSNVPPDVNNIDPYEHMATPLEPLPSLLIDTVPSIEPLPAHLTESLPPVSEEPVSTITETIPPLYSQDSQTLPTPETIPSIVNMEAPPTTELPTPETPPLYTYSTTPTPYSLDESNNQYSVQEPASTEDTNLSPDMNVEDIIAALPAPIEDTFSTSTEAPVQEDNSESFFSNMYSTIVDILPSSTESPESLYNAEYPTYESEKAYVNEGFSFMKYVMSLYYLIMGTSEETKALFASVGETCFTDEYCDGTSNDGTNRLLTFLLTTASSVLLFTLGYYYIDNRRQDSRLIATINSLQRDLLFATKECEILKEELANTKNKLAGIEDSSFGMDDMVLSLKEEINELKATNDRLRNSLDDNEKLLRVSENTAGELQNTLGEVENTLSELLAERANSEEQIVELNGKIQAFEEELISVSRERDNFQLKYVSAETVLEEYKKQKKQFEEVNQLLAETKNTVELQKHEIEALKDAIKELKSGMSADVDVTSFLDHTEIKAKLSKALLERKSYESKFETEYKERTRLADELKATQETLNTTTQSATEALTRLEVLGKYFQERESELLKELSAKESLWLSKQGESASTVEKIELLQQEVQRYKEKCDALTLELAEQESSRRSALSEVESRAHSAWLEARAAKRDADAARDDAAALRRKLASLSTAADGAVSPHHKVSSPLGNVDNSVIPPPLPPMFLPPPLLPPLPRPPPLGRLPSPHPPRYGDRRYSPDSRYSPESRYSPDSRYSPETVRYSPESRYSPRALPHRRSPYSPRSRRRSRSRERYEDNRVSRSRNGPAPPDTETEYNSDSPTRQPRRRRRYSRESGPSSGSGCSSESDK